MCSGVMRRGQLGASPEVIQTRHPNTMSTSNGIDFFPVFFQNTGKFFSDLFGYLLLPDKIIPI